MKRGKKSALILLWAALGIIMTVYPVFADNIQQATTFKVEGAYYLDDNKGYGVADGGFASISYTPEEIPTGFTSIGNDEGRSLGSGWGPAKIQFLLNHTITVPFLTTSNPLMSGNNAAFSFTGALTPVSTRLELGAKLTPIAFLNLYCGALAGTGWDIKLFNGMGLNDDGSGVPESASFKGAVLKSWIGGTFQFDLAALVPGDWTHVVILISPKLQYNWFSGAEKEQEWMFEADEGEYFNGWKFYGSFFLGYQMPLAVDTLGVLVEIEQNLGYAKELSEMSAGWGSDFVRVTISPLLKMAISEKSSLALLFQIRRKRLYTDATIFYNFYQNRIYTGTYWDFHRIAFSYSLKL